MYIHNHIGQKKSIDGIVQSVGP